MFPQNQFEHFPSLTGFPWLSALHLTICKFLPHNQDLETTEVVLQQRTGCPQELEHSQAGFPLDSTILQHPWDNCSPPPARDSRNTSDTHPESLLADGSAG